jgi:hypothetical protein
MWSIGLRVGSMHATTEPSYSPSYGKIPFRMLNSLFLSLPIRQLKAEGKSYSFCVKKVNWHISYLGVGKKIRFGIFRLYIPQDSASAYSL